MGGVAIVVFSDLVDSTALLAVLGDDRMDRVRRAHVSDVKRAVGDSGGRVVKTLGDGVMASFESALGALRAGAAIQASVERLDRANGGIGIAARVGIAAGEPIPDGEDLHGMTVVIASRLSSAAATGEVLVHELVRELVASREGFSLENASEYELKGVPSPVRASRLSWRELLATDAVQGPMGAEETSNAAERSTAPRPFARLPRALAAYAEEPLIGRDREIGFLREATAPRDGCCAVSILGEPGIGKTRHAAAAASEAHALGATVVLARCPPEPVVPFEPWVRAVGELALAGDAEWRKILAEVAGPEFSALVPELSEHAESGEATAAASTVLAEGARYRLLRGIGATLARAADGTPLHIVLDDAHWCDPASAQALEHMLEGSHPQLALVVTARDRELGRRHPVSRVLAGLRRTGDLEELRLEGLDASGTAALVSAKVGRSITPGLAARLQARTAGNPFFAGELVRDLDGMGVLREGEALDTAPVPSAVADLVEERLSRLDPKTERLLCAVAAIGPSARVGLAARAARLDPEEAGAAIEEALAERLVDEVAAAEPTVAFPHALVREALIAATGEVARARLHLALARALEDEGDAEPAELARHHGLAVGLAGPESAIAAYRGAAEIASERHDHEQAVAHLRSALALFAEGDMATRGPALLELAEQELLAANLVSARDSFRAAIEVARQTGDAETLARAALGFAGGDVGFGWEIGTDDPASMQYLQEGLDALGDDEPRLALRMIFRLAYLMVFTKEPEVLADLDARAAALGARLDDVEGQILTRFTKLAHLFVRNEDPLHSLEIFERGLEGLFALEPDCPREDLRFRIVQWSVSAHYANGEIEECEAAIERMGEIAERLGSPRFAWEVDAQRGMRCLDKGERERGEALMRGAAVAVRRLRPDLHMALELLALSATRSIFDGDYSATRLGAEAVDVATPRAFSKAFKALGAAFDDDVEATRQLLREVVTGDLELLRGPDGHLPASICTLAYAAARVEDVGAASHLLPLLEQLGDYLISPQPTVALGSLPGWHIGQLRLLRGEIDEAVAALRAAIDRADELGVGWIRTLARVDMARAFHRRGDTTEALAALAEAEELTERHGMRIAVVPAARVRAELEGRPAEPVARAQERARPIRALAARGGRRALASMARGLDDAELENRFADPRRQRSLLRAMLRGFQPAQADGFRGVVAYELEPLAVEPPADAPWRWALEIDSRAGHAHLVEPAPLDAAATVHFGLADWVRVTAGIENPLAAMFSGRCRVEGDVEIAMRLEPMFGG
jgi:class 3 adenylate cyclase/ATP/maltotriose-dependent transcriptional regulator MalT